jgi:hypothetical protein
LIWSAGGALTIIGSIDEPGRSLMRSFVAALAAAIVIAGIAAVALNAIQTPAEVAFTTGGARI